MSKKNDANSGTSTTNNTGKNQEYHLDVNTSDGNSIVADRICISAKNGSYRECVSSVSETTFNVPNNGRYFINVSHDAYEPINGTTYIWESGQKGTVYMDENNSTSDNSSDTVWVS